MSDIPAKCNGTPKPTTSPTPYGNWVCEAGGWTWYPLIGKSAEEKLNEETCGEQSEE